MNYTLNDINCFIEAEKRKDVLPKEYFHSIAVTNFCETPTEELMATFEVCMLTHLVGLQMHVPIRSSDICLKMARLTFCS